MQLFTRVSPNPDSLSFPPSFFFFQPPCRALYGTTHRSLFFQNKSRHCPIRGMPDDVPGVPYRTGPKGWMDKRVSGEWLIETCAISKDAFRRQRTICLDNCSGHLESDIQRENLAKTNAVIKFLPKNATHLCQPADSFAIQNIKQRWIL